MLLYDTSTESGLRAFFRELLSEWLDAINAKLYSQKMPEINNEVQTFLYEKLFEARQNLQSSNSPSLTADEITFLQAYVRQKIAELWKKSPNFWGFFIKCLTKKSKYDIIFEERHEMAITCQIESKLDSQYKYKYFL